MNPFLQKWLIPLVLITTASLALLLFLQVLWSKS
jgi:hypothetical protein